MEAREDPLQLQIALAYDNRAFWGCSCRSHPCNSSGEHTVNEVRCLPVVPRLMQRFPRRGSAEGLFERAHVIRRKRLEVLLHVQHFPWINVQTKVHFNFEFLIV